MATLNPQQRLAAESPCGPLLIVAGAGTGKTRTLTSRVVHLIKQGIPPEKICAITFTNKAANEMVSRIAATTDIKQLTTDEEISNSQMSNVRSQMLAGSGTPFIGTFHSLGAKILREGAHLLGRKPNFVIFDSDDSFSLIKKIVKKFFPTRLRQGFDGQGKRWEEKNRDKKEGPAFFAKKISEIKNLERGANPLPLYKSGERVHANDTNIEKIFSEYENELKKNNAFDFDDLIEKPVALFQKYPNLLKKYRNKFDAILVDEYQDLNPKQYELIRLLAGEHKNLSVVGDDEQMIYGWRYADIKVFLDFERGWPGAQIAFLEENYRSTANIIMAAQSVAENNQYRRPKNLWTKNPEGVPIKIVEVENEEQEAAWIAREVELRIMNNELSGGAKKSIIHNSSFIIPTTAVLYRTNAQSRAIEQALIQRQIPYKIFGGVRFYERKEIKDIVAALRWVFNPKDAVSRERLEKNLSKSRFSRLETALAERRTNAPPQLIKAFLEATGYLEYIEKNFLNHEERRENIAELINFASKYEDLGRFLEEVALVQPTDLATSNLQLASGQSPEGGSQLPVNLMTIHLSKGLEFDKVFIAGCNEGLLPHSMSLDGGYQPTRLAGESVAGRLEEERRLMYVAMTRAKHELNIGFYDLPSRFIGEIPQELVEYLNYSQEEAGSASTDFENYVSLED